MTAEEFGSLCSIECETDWASVKKRLDRGDKAIALLREIMDYCDADLKSASGKTYRKVCEYLDGGEQSDG